MLHELFATGIQLLQMVGMLCLLWGVFVLILAFGGGGRGPFAVVKGVALIMFGAPIWPGWGIWADPIDPERGVRSQQQSAWPAPLRLQCLEILQRLDGSYESIISYSSFLTYNLHAVTEMRDMSPEEQRDQKTSFLKGLFAGVAIETTVIGSYSAMGGSRMGAPAMLGTGIILLTGALLVGRTEPSTSRAERKPPSSTPTP